MSDMLFSDKSKLTAKPDQVQQGPENAPSISPMRIQRMGPMDLQRLVGNQATQRLLRKTDSSTPTVIQAKMTVGAANDPYEQEADAVAAKVVSDTPAPDSVQRNAAPGEQEEMETEAIAPMRIQRNADLEDEAIAPMRIQRNADLNGDDISLMRIQRNAAPGEQEEMETEAIAPMRLQREEVDMMGSFDAGAEVESGINSTRGGGQALPDDTRGMLESKMGHDFSGVNIHTDAHSDSLNRAVGAKAFTTGSDVYFSQGAFDPGSKDGQQLLAHELTHVVQQGGAAPIQPDREDK